MSALNGYTERAARMRALGPDLNRAQLRRTRETEGQSFPPPQQVQIINLEVSDVDDDDISVMNSPPRAFSQVGTARRTRRRINDQSTTADNITLRRSRRVLERTQIVTQESSNSMAPELPRESIFKCPICLDPFIEEMSTMCGHIFCKKCITTVVATQRKCPTCRKFVTMEELRRVFLPSTN